MKRSKQGKTKYGIAIIGMLILALFLALFGYFSEQTGNPTGWKFYVPMIGSLVGVALIIIGIIAGKRKNI